MLNSYQKQNGTISQKKALRKMRMCFKTIEEFQLVLLNKLGGFAILPNEIVT